MLDICTLLLRYGRYQTAKRLLQGPYAKQMINEEDRMGQTALHYACRHGFPRVVELLLSQGALFLKYPSMLDAFLHFILLFVVVKEIGKVITPSTQQHQEDIQSVCLSFCLHIPVLSIGNALMGTLLFMKQLPSVILPLWSICWLRELI
jgi:ankyrin repeat protein